MSVKNTEKKKWIIGDCNKFYKKIDQHLNFLFHDYGFSWVFKDDKRSDCIGILKSAQCCIRVVRDRGTPFLYLGPVSAIENPYGSEEVGWHYIDVAIDFVNNDPKGEIRKKLKWRAGDVYENTEDLDPFDYDYIQYIVKLKKYGSQIFELFQKKKFKKIRSKLEKFSLGDWEKPYITVSTKNLKTEKTKTEDGA
jgi:hypothetical protein